MTTSLSKGLFGPLVAFAFLAPTLFTSGVNVAHAAPCDFWPDRILRINNEGASNLLFLLRANPSPENPAKEMGGLFKKYDPKNKCQGNFSAMCRDVNKWIEIPAIQVSSWHDAYREDSLTLYLGSERAPFLYEGVFYLTLQNGERKWLNNPGDENGNFWFTLDSTTSLPQSSSWEFDMMRVPRTAEIAHWSNPSGCN